jgi:hypothetical protein
MAQRSATALTSLSIDAVHLHQLRRLARPVVHHHPVRRGEGQETLTEPLEIGQEMLAEQ